MDIVVTATETYENALDVGFHVICCSNSKGYLTFSRLDPGSVPYGWFMYIVQLCHTDEGIGIELDRTSHSENCITLLSPEELLFPLHITDGEWAAALCAETVLFKVLDDLVDM